MTKKMKFCLHCKHFEGRVTPEVYMADVCSYHWVYYPYCTLHRKRLIKEYDEAGECSDYEEENEWSQCRNV